MPLLKRQTQQRKQQQQSSRAAPPQATAAELVAGFAHERGDADLQQQRGGIERRGVFGAGRRGVRRKQMQQVGALDVPDIVHVLHAGKAAVGDCREDRVLALAGERGGLRQVDEDALADRRARGERLRNVDPDPLDRLGPGLIGVEPAADAESQCLGILHVGPVAQLQHGADAAAAVLLEQVETGLRLRVTAVVVADDERGEFFVRHDVAPPIPPPVPSPASGGGLGRGSTSTRTA